MAAAAATTTANSSAPPVPPVARREEDRFVLLGKKDGGLVQSESSSEPLVDPPVRLPDPHGWLRQDEDRTDNLRKDVEEHLKAENDYVNAVTSHLEPLRKTLYEELVSVVQETDYTTPRPKDDYYYYTRTVEGKSYSIYCRAPRLAEDDAGVPELLKEWDGTASAPVLPGEEVLLDVNVFAEERKAPYCSVGAFKASPSQKLAAFTVDLSGDETCRLVVKRIDSGQVLFDDLEIYGQLQFGADDGTVFYLKKDETKRPYRLYRRKLDLGDGGADGGEGAEGGPYEEELLYEEPDQLFSAHMYKSLDGKYLFVSSDSTETTEVWYLDLQDPDAKLQCVSKRRLKVLYEVEHRDGSWWILSNVGNLPNMALFVAPAEPECDAKWSLVKNSEGEVLFDGKCGVGDATVSDITPFANHVVLSGRQGGLPRIWIASGISATDASVSSCEPLSFEEEAHDIGLSTNREYDTEKVMVCYDSIVTPPQWIEIDLNDPDSVESRTVWKEQNVPGYDKSMYGCERCHVLSRDGKAKIPVSMVYRKDAMTGTGPKPVHLYGYGSYSACMEADFVKTRIPMLKRGVVWVLAHIRGGGEMGRPWYEMPDGAKYLCKKNTFNDFVDVARWLIEDRKLTTPDKLSCEGRSAGGLLIGASINQAPELFRVALMGVPFVDVVCTMTDSTIPLTVGEWEEWGNPNEIKYHKYMMEYCPMQNVRDDVPCYPSVLMTCGLHDPVSLLHQFLFKSFRALSLLSFL